jgi:hypothetical protein
LKFLSNRLISKLISLSRLLKLLPLLSLFDLSFGQRTRPDILVILEIPIFIVLGFELFLQRLQFLQFPSIIFLLLELVLELSLQLQKETSFVIDCEVGV